jgi:cobalt-zinc-cadmium efflux system membrane fusion protein
MTPLLLWSLGVVSLLSVSFVSCSQRHGAEASSQPERAAASSSAAGNPGIHIQIEPGSPMLAQIRTSVVRTEQVPTEVVDAPGQIEADPNRMSRVVLPLAGRVAAVLVRVGDTVQRGQPVLLLESPDVDSATSSYMQAEASVNSAKSVVIKAQADYDRAKDLFQNSAVAQKDVLTAESTLAQAKASLETAVAVREQAQRRLSLLGLTGTQYGQKLEVRAPISGKILEMAVAPNEYRNDTNASLMTIADLSEVWVSSDVPETKIRFIQPGEQIDLSLEAYPDKDFHARVTRIADTVDATTRTIKVHAELANPGGQLRPDMFGRIRHVESVAPMPAVPLAAVVQTEGHDYVYRESAEGVFDRIAVTLGNRLGDMVGVKTGLKAGDRIVTDGVMLLKGQ